MFDTLKDMFITAPVLVYLDSYCPLHIETDALAFVIDVALSQKCANDKWQPYVYYSHGLSGRELNWSVYDKELYAILKVFE